MSSILDVIFQQLVIFVKAEEIGDKTDASKNLYARCYRDTSIQTSRKSWSAVTLQTVTLRNWVHL